MPQNNPQVKALLKNIRLFDGLDELQLDQVAADVHPVYLKEGAALQVDAADGTFFVVMSGKVRQTQLVRGREGASYVLKPGDFFGADGLFRGKAKANQITALKPALLFSFQVDDLRSLVNTTPVLTKNITKQLAWYSLIRSKPFNWLGEEETVKLICRKHPAYLLVIEIIPLVIAWIGLLVILIASTQISTASFRLVVGWTGAAVVGGAALWAIWRYIDWGNDYYVLTDERIVWLERTLGLYDSRQEAPLVAIKSGESKSSQIGRWLGYGDVITQTFMGQVFFKHIGNPADIKTAIDQERLQAVERQMTTDVHAIEGKIRQKIEPAPGGATVPSAARAAAITQRSSTAPAPDVNASPEKLNFWQSLVARFQTRREVNGVITYRKHLYVLFTMTWLPAACVLGLTFGTGLVYSWSVRDKISLLSPGTILLLGIALIVISGLWWLYKFVDWSNDIYRVTPDKIIDSERKPLGDEISRSAPLENIIGLDFEKLGFLGVVLNFGNVVINIGTDNKFIFYGIHNPARAQRDIFNYMFAQRRRKQLSDTQQEQERVSSYIAAYHRQAEDIRQTTKKPPQF